jgi:hypothetical protein
MLNVTGVRTQAFSNSVLETARKALTKLFDVNIDGGVYVVPTSIWEQLELTVLGTGSGPTPCRPRRAQLPVDLAARRLWGQRVVVSSVISDANNSCCSRWSTRGCGSARR